VGKYKRPPNDPLLLERSAADLMLEFYTDLYEEKADLERALEVPDSGQGPQRERLARLLKILGETATVAEDDLVEQWERDLAAGRVPDLELTPEQARRKKG
jgi:hypothetical protein